MGTHDSSVSSETSLRHRLKFREKPAKEKGPGDSSGDRDGEVPTIIFYKNFQLLFPGNHYIESIFYAS